jgi:NAD-dependent DNA ligase
MTEDRYYVLDAPILSDYDYDMLEKEYEALVVKLGLPNSASEMVGFDETRPSCRLIADLILGG